jgi:pimeloyl-ACP methyl ester carboxylesterase
VTIRQVEVWGRRIVYVDAGPADADVLLCLHGGGFDHSCLTWRPITDALSGHRRLIVPDLPGYGQSEALEESPDLRRLGAWTGAFVDALGLGRADVAGLSMGGGMALWLAIHRPERVGRLIPVCPYGVMPRAPFHLLAFAAFRAGFLPLAYRAATLSAPLARLGLALNYGDPSRVTAGTVAQLRRVAEVQAGRRSFDAFLEAEMDASGLKTDFRPDLHRITVPTLLIGGRHDRMVPLARLRSARARIPDCRLVTLPTGHWPMRERPDLFERVLERFLSDREPGAQRPA